MAKTTDEDLIFSVAFGPLHPPLAEQLAGQGVVVDRVGLFERARDSITFLRLHGYLADGAAMVVQNKLMRDLKKNTRRMSAP